MGSSKKPTKGISRRAILKRGLYSGLAAGLAPSLCFGGNAKQGCSQGRNMIVIVIDTLRLDALGCYGNRLSPTPQIDAIAAEGVRFDQAISSSGWTLPAIASLLTGAHPSIHGAQGKVSKLTPIRSELPTAAEVFKKNGFDNTFGLANCAFLSPMLQLGRGFDVYDSRHAYNWKIRRADETIDTALKLIGKYRNESNFIFIHLFDPHLDYDPQRGYKWKFTSARSEVAPPLTMKSCKDMMTKRGKGPPVPADIEYIKGVYYGEVNFVDVHVGKLVDKLKEMGVYGRTTLVVTSDHGEEFWEHGGFEHGHSLYDELIRIPLIVKLPDSVRPINQVVSSQVRHLDVIPTLFDLADIEQPKSFVGQSLMPFIMGQSKEDLIAFSECTLYGSDKLSWRTGSYKYIYDLHAQAKRVAELYDWQNDPGEKEDLVTEQPEVVRELHQQLGRFTSGLQVQAETMSQPKAKNMSPKAIRSLKSLGYIR